MHNISKQAYRFASGLRAEAYFRQLIIKQGFEWTKTNLHDDRNLHYDCSIHKDNSEFFHHKVEVKSIKKIDKRKPYQDELTWIELHGIRKEDKGWLYGGKANSIVFELKDKFVLVPRLKLLELVNEFINLSTYVLSPLHAYYNLYKRGKGYDILTIIKTKELKTLTTLELIKDEYFDVHQLHHVKPPHLNHLWEDIKSQIHMVNPHEPLFIH